MLNSKVENVLLLVFSLLKKEEVSNWNVNSPHLVGFCRRKKNHNKSSSSVFESSIPSHRSLSPFMNIFAVFAVPNQMKNFTPINHLDDTWTDIGGQIKDRAQKWIALFDMPNSNRFDILSISIFSEISLSISIFS